MLVLGLIAKAALGTMVACESLTGSGTVSHVTESNKTTSVKIEANMVYKIGENIQIKRRF